MDFDGYSSDQRRFVRVGADLAVQVRALQETRSSQIWNAITQDLSEGGIQLSSFQFFPIYTRLLLEVIVSQYGEPLRSVGRVVWVERLPYQERYKVGVEFSSLSDNERENLRKVVLANV